MSWADRYRAEADNWRAMAELAESGVKFGAAKSGPQFCRDAQAVYERLAREADEHARRKTC